MLTPQQIVPTAWSAVSEFLAMAALVTFSVTVTGLLIVGVARLALAVPDERPAPDRATPRGGYPRRRSPGTSSARSPSPGGSASAT